MFAALIPNLITLILTVRKNLFASVMTTLMILSIIFAWSARGNVATWFEQNPSAEQQSERAQRAGESNSKIDQALRQDLDVLGADRVLIRQFHDLSDPDTRNVIPYVTTTHMVTAPGVTSPTSAIISMPRSYVSDIARLVWHSGSQCVHLLTTEVHDEIYMRLLTESGVYEQYVCPIVDLNGAPVGLIMAAYLTPTKERPSQNQIFEKLNDTSIRVAGYLAEVTAPERQAWYRRLLSI